MAIRKIKNKVQNSRAALQGRIREALEHRRHYEGLVRLWLERDEQLEDELVAAQEAAQRYNAAADALDKERERLDGVFAARLQQARNEIAQARNEIAQLTGQVDTLVVRCHRLEVDKANAEFSAERAREGRTTMLACSLIALVLQTVYYEEWYVPVVEFVKGLL